MNAKDKAQRRWFRFPVDVPFTGKLGEDPARYLLSADEVERAAAFGPLDEVVRIPDEQEEA